MLETIKKSVLTGVGLALRSKGEIEELAKEFAKQSKMDQTEAKQFLNECHKKYENSKEGFDKKIETAIEKILKKLDLATQSDMKLLNQRIDELMEKLSDTKKE